MGGLDEIGQYVIESLISKHLEFRQKASGDWIDSLSYDVDDNSVIISGFDYTEFLSKGRRPNQDQNPKALRNWAVWAGNTFIKDWAKAKGVNIDPIAIAYKIGARDGTDYFKQGGTDLIDGVINAELITELQEIYSDFLRVQVADELTRRVRELAL